MELGIRKRQRGSDAIIRFRALVWMPADAQMNGIVSHVHVQWFSYWKIKADDCDVKK